MFANLGWGEVLVLVIIGLVVLGPERLPGAIRWTSQALRQTRDYLNNASAQIREDLGPEFDDLREPLTELNKLRGMTPRAAITKHLLDGDDSILNFDDALTEPPASAAGGGPGPGPGDRPGPGDGPTPGAGPGGGPGAGPGADQGLPTPRFDPDAT